MASCWATTPPRHAEHVDGVVPEGGEERAATAACCGIDIGSGGVLEPPVPGVSKLMSCRSVGAARNGCHISRLPPRPMTSRSAVRCH
jgi:hypothetical protein